MLANQNLKRLYIAFMTILISMTIICSAQIRQRNIVYVLDCTGSMGGYNGSANIWEPTKNFLKTELIKEAKDNPNSKVTILPFQEKVLQPITINLKNICWSSLENTLDSYLKRLTPTNICDSWTEAEKHIDQTCDNQIVFMTDGRDNIGGEANTPNRIAKLEKIINAFCCKYQNTKAFYVELTDAATLPTSVRNLIELCKDIVIVDAKDGIPHFGCFSEEVININSRDLPIDITLGFSNLGTFNTSLIYNENPYLNFSIKDNQIKQGKIILHVESKFGDDIDKLNKVIDAPDADFMLNIQSQDVDILNPKINVILCTTPLRIVDFTINQSKIERIKPFLWIKGNPSDTLRWNLSPDFNQEAIKEKSSILFRVNSNKNLDGAMITFNGESLSRDSIISVHPNQPLMLETIIPNTIADGNFDFKLTAINTKNLDRLNGQSPKCVEMKLSGEINTKTSIFEIIFWILSGLIIIYILAWFLFIRNQKYPKFKKGVITIQSPYYATIRVKGYRKIVLTSKTLKQGFFDKIWKGKILYHTNPNWANDVEITPSGKNMRFGSSSNTLICSPQPLLMRGESYEITDTSNLAFKITININ